MGIKFSNNAASTLAGSLTAIATTVSVAAGEGARFPSLGASDWFMATIVKLVAGVPTWEIIKVTARSGDTLTMLRGQESTTGLIFSGGDKIELRMTASALDSKADTDAPAFTGAASFAGPTNFNDKATFAGSATKIGAALVSVSEKTTISATAATGTINFDRTTQGILYYTANASANWTMNLRGNGSNSLDSLMAVGDSVTSVFMATQGATPFFASACQVDGASVTPKWQGGTAPTAGNASGIDIYSYTVLKTAAATFTVLASQSQFK